MQTPTDNELCFFLRRWGYGLQLSTSTLCSVKNSTAGMGEEYTILCVCVCVNTHINVEKGEVERVRMWQQRRDVTDP
jgi:hypothetical protein